MERGILPALSSTVLIAALALGCSGEPKRPAEPEPDRAKAREAAPAAPQVDRRPVRAGDYLVYPLKWRNAYETAFQLQALLYPKYGPLLQIVPDPDTNSLLIYLPPRETRFSEMMR